jgi:hypothetical protein
MLRSNYLHFLNVLTILNRLVIDPNSQVVEYYFVVVEVVNFVVEKFGIDSEI